MSNQHIKRGCETYKYFNVRLNTGSNKETIRDKKPNQGFNITPHKGKFVLRLHNSYMGEYKTEQACQIVINQHHRREVIRAIEKKEESIDTYWDEM